MGLKEWSSDAVVEHRAGEHESAPSSVCYPCHIGSLRYNTFNLRFWNNSKDSANEISKETQNLAKKEGRDLIPDKRWT